MSHNLIKYIQTQMISINGPRSYAEVNAESGARYRAMNLTFSFKTSSKNGVLFYASAQGTSGFTSGF